MQDFDVAIIGGGPAGATAGCLLKKYDPNLRVSIFEREAFPRDHVGESQLPPISHILAEMDCWDKIESANFPIKIGATYRWGKTPELWDFDFVQAEAFDEPRPGKFEGKRKSTAFQVDRAIYDKIVLDHAAELGCRVFENAQVVSIEAEDDFIKAAVLRSGDRISARHYIDASGNSGVIRRALGVEIDSPTSLQNVAVWDYWQNAEWAVKIGVGGTRIQIYSLPYGWIWFIPLGPTRTSVGLVIPVEYFKSSGKTLAELYTAALSHEPIIGELLNSAQSETKLQTTKDWSFLSSRHYGGNWFLAGESAGFADPILSAGMSLAHAAGREAAYTILAIESGKEEPTWLRNQFEVRQSQRIKNHIRFADYWYTANAQFKDLQEFTSQIARENDLDLSPEKAWAWIAQGGFINEDVTTGAGGYSLAEIKSLGKFLTAVTPDSSATTNNVFVLDVEGAEIIDRAHYEAGAVRRTKAYVRNGKILPEHGAFGFLIGILRSHSALSEIIASINSDMEKFRSQPEFRNKFIGEVLQAFEAMIGDGWIQSYLNPSQPLADITISSGALHWHRKEPNLANQTSNDLDK